MRNQQIQNRAFSKQPSHVHVCTGGCRQEVWTGAHEQKERNTMAIAQTTVPWVGGRKGSGAETLKPNPSGGALAGNMKIPSCQGCQGTHSQGQDYVIQRVFPVKCVWHILGWQKPCLRSPLWSVLIFLIRTRGPFSGFPQYQLSVRYI